MATDCSLHCGLSRFFKYIYEVSVIFLVVMCETFPGRCDTVVYASQTGSWSLTKMTSPETQMDSNDFVVIHIGVWDYGWSRGEDLSLKSTPQEMWLFTNAATLGLIAWLTHSSIVKISLRHVWSVFPLATVELFTALSACGRVLGTSSPTHTMRQVVLEFTL